MVVDDELEVREVLREFLTAKGYEVHAVDSGAAAVASLDTVEPDVVLLDVSMPDMDGVETLQRLVAARPALPVIMVTANADVGITSKLLGLGAADYVPKPFDLEYLDQAVAIQISGAREG
jgi:DNA-binding response OmpR family regulator